ncbi:DUF6363 domain-containing protein [Romboutsia lituseburensis]|uniref:DUF6363 domain-containing protein n=1 Tax=Romboutsia lituseburensis TaxID=1537 RepID=UPI00215AA7B8|nr:DUF6363 domain-containing protein [Romboutsia lituseburensis]MCR8747039.1 patatin-like phospholipase family protein [Romboutsia lituseburensis]
MSKVGLILEGGGMRGIYTAGVLDFFIEKDIEVDMVIGVSAGSCHASSYLSKQYKRAYHATIDYIHDKNYLSFNNLIKTGSILGMDFMFNTIPNLIKAVKNRHINYNESLKLVNNLSENEDTLVIRPKNPVNVSQVEKNISKLTALYEEGYNNAKQMCNQILEFIDKNKKIKVTK